MGTKAGTFVNLAGETIAVTFVGHGVATGTLELVNVQLQMDGGRGEYIPVQYATASVTCVVDGIGLLDVFATRPLDVAVEVRNETAGTVLFAGYVSPNTYNQSLSGYNDEITIECADWLATAKAVPYPLLDEARGLQAYTLADALLYMAERLSPSATVKVAQAIVIESGDKQHTTERYDLLTLNESYFLTSIDPTMLPTGPSVKPNIKSIYDALSMITESLRLTAVQIGTTIYLIDRVMHKSDGGCRYRELSRGTSASLAALEGETVTLTADNLEGVVQISALPSYSMYSLARPTEPAEVELLQDMLSDTYLSVDGAPVTYKEDAHKRTYAQRLRSSIYDAAYVDTARQANFIGYIELDAWYEQSSFFETYWGDGRGWSNVLRILNSGNNSEDYVKVLSRKMAFGTALQERSSVDLRLDIEAAFSNDASRLYPYNLMELSPAARPLLGISLRVGSKYYVSPGVWQDEEHIKLISVFAYPAGDWSNEVFGDLYSYDFRAYECPGGDVELSLYIPPKGAEGNLNRSWYVAYIRKFALAAVENMNTAAISASKPWPKTEYLGSWDAYSQPMETVTPPIEIRAPFAERFWGTAIGGVEYMTEEPTDSPADTGRVTVNMRYRESENNSNYYTMLERIKRLAELAGTHEFEVKLAGTAYTPLTAIQHSILGGRKVITSLSKDIYNNQTTATL